MTALADPSIDRQQVPDDLGPQELERAGGGTWQQGPWVRKAFRELWNETYAETKEELERLRHYPGTNCALDDPSIAIAAWNIAYLVYWNARDSASRR